MNFTQQLQNQAAQTNSRILFPRSSDERVLYAAEYLATNNIAEVFLVVNDHVKPSIHHPNVHWLHPKSDPYLPQLTEHLFTMRKSKGWTMEMVKNALNDPLYFGACYLALGFVDTCVAGSIATTGDVIRAAIHSIGLHDESETISSSFIMELEDQRLVSFADCAVIPEPTDTQLANIAYDAAKTFESLTGLPAKIALLSFSTRGSAEHERVTKVRDALSYYRKRYNTYPIDGELQFDAAWDEAVAKRKAPDSSVAGDANVFVFPNLESGNIGYKLVQRLAGAMAMGPILQGLKKPMLDLSRGCSAQDIIHTSYLGILLSQSK